MSTAGNHDGRSVSDPNRSPNLFTLTRHIATRGKRWFQFVPLEYQPDVSLAFWGAFKHTFTFMSRWSLLSCWKLRKKPVSMSKDFSTSPQSQDFTLIISQVVDCILFKQSSCMVCYMASVPNHISSGRKTTIQIQLKHYPALHVTVLHIRL